MYDLATRKRALALIAQGRSLNSVSREMGISRWSLKSWQQRLHPAPSRGAPCWRCAGPPGLPQDTAAYSYLLGLYLGDGCISRLARTYFLRIACADAWPGLIVECERAVKAVCPENSVFRIQRQGCVNVTAYHSHWPCLLPQHGPGRKHTRSIALEPWQRAIVGEHPWPFVRGLIHSDGCRITNWTTRTVAGQRKRYEYPRYFFTNRSDEILRLFTDTLDALGVECRSARHRKGGHNISVARRASVALMDLHVGPKS
ncbi:hypothetical protein GCM10009801_33170 [Streptomyces albiaxialis]|uniref:Transcriptional regulator n=1 Tax=Streptomyces albiaxialis TaxID=329523 RepID=A0ABN2VY61_9ACTN